MSKYNPPKGKGDPIDYNKDGVVDSGDDIFAVKDYDGDGAVTSKEETKFRQERDATNTKYVYEGDKLVETKVTGSGKDVPEPGLDFSEYTQKFLANKPEVKKAIELAIEYKWTQEQFNRYIETKTEWGRKTTDAQALFDLQIKGSKAEDLEQTIKRRFDLLKEQADTAGVAISDADLQKFARSSVRSALDEADIRGWIASKFSMPSTTGQPTDEAQVMEGTAASIGDELKQMARSYGVTITDETLQKKIQQGLKQGGSWREWVEGQRNLFRQNAKSLYPSASENLDNFTLEELLDPYLEDAAAMLGVQRNNMDISNPMWTKALENPDGSPMTRDQWMTTLRTDKQYGWDKTNKARAEAAEIGDELLRMFGMA